MSQVRVEATIRRGHVYVKLDDVIKTLLSDFADLEDHESAVKKFIKDNIETWERYEEGILEEAKNR